MLVKPASRFIWQKDSPAPFESAWSIFSKVLALNGKKPYWIAKLIAKNNFTLPASYFLNYRDSSWIDFERFAGYLDVAQSRLRFAFLDQMGIQLVSPPFTHPGIKICPDCLKKGYHCIFFELGIIDICPWHKKKLEPPCRDCYYSVSHSGLKPFGETSSQSNVMNEDGNFSEWNVFKSSCKHIYFNEGYKVRLNKLTSTEEDAIINECFDFLGWWKKVSQNKDIESQIVNISVDPRRSKKLHSDKFISAAENIAGPCPWPIGVIRKPIRSHTWKQLGNENNFDNDRASRKSEWGVTYRTIRRYIFRRYVRQHRDCWNELASYEREYSSLLDSDAVCPVALAYASWRLSIELFSTTEALKISKLREAPIRVMELPYKEFAKTPLSHASLLYGYFFQIWESILEQVGKNSFSITIDTPTSSTFPVASMFNSQTGLNRDGVVPGEWTIIFPDGKLLERLSYITCCGRIKSKKYNWMLYSATVNWTHFYNTYRSRLIYELRRDTPLGHLRAPYQYLYI